MRSWLLLGSVALLGCIGEIGAPDGDGTGDDGAGASSALSCDTAPLPLSHLTRAQYDRTIRDLFGVALDASVSASFPKDEEVEGFSLGLGMSTLLVEKQQGAAEVWAERAMEHPERIVPCSTADDACAAAFIASFGRRAFRRPLAEDEIERLMTVYRFARESGARPFDEGLRLVIEAILVSPHFLYHWPTSEGADAEGVVRVAGYELASRMSYFLWGTMPDDALLDAADAGKLHTKEDVAREARRMLEDPRAREGVSGLFDELYDVGMVSGLNRDPVLFSDWSTDVGRDLSTSLAMSLDDAFWNGKTFSDLFTSNEVFLNENLATFYGLERPAGEGFVPVTDARRGGLLTHPALVTRFSKFSATDPIHRGLFVWERVLCRNMQPPPPDVVFTVPSAEEEPGKTTRERYEMHLDDACAGCHGVIDPLGFAFEHFDAVGRHRADENGIPIDATGTVILDDAGEVPFDDVVDLGAVLAESDDARRCYVEHWVHAAVRRGGTQGDTCQIDDLDEAFEEAGGNLADLAVLIVTSDAFLSRHAPLDQTP